VDSLVLGVDGGNTKSIALLAAPDGHVLGAGRSGCGDIYGTSPSAALSELDAAIVQALRQAGATNTDIGTATFSLAGADWPEDFAFLRSELSQRVPRADEPVVVNDAIGALRAGSESGDGVSLVVGTGSAIGARSGERLWHSSFWGEDCGALAIGRKALRAIVRAELGLGLPTDLTGQAIEAMAVDSVEALLHTLTRREASRTLVGDLAPVVLDSAENGDPIARAIVETTGDALAGYVNVAAARVGLGLAPFQLVLAGGVLRHDGSLLRSRLVAGVPNGRPIMTRLEPAVGALLLAFDRHPGQLDVASLEGSLPPAAFFGTTPSPTLPAESPMDTGQQRTVEAP
jgi:N-acetylglucosamine kinase-like BadF-type ATPase